MHITSTQPSQQYTSSGESHLAARRFKGNPRTWVQTHVLPGDSSCATRQFLENSRNTNCLLHFLQKLRCTCIPINQEMIQFHIKHII